MFSEHLKKVDPVSRLGLFGVVAGLIFVCQLVALVMVANGQVQKAQHRDVQDKAAKTAMLDCAKNYSGSARTLCIDQVNVALNPYPSFSPAPVELATAQAAGQHRSATAGAPSSAANGRGFMQAAFDSSQ
ncbi:MAG: hypothetical protein JWR60_142 [Polaromonas sp.]|nr:hypothetical protein [Polaromonas sp.]